MKISVVIAVLNQAAELESTLKSVQSQSCPNLECLVIDGGSVDGSVEVIREHSHWLKYWQSEPDRGVYDAMNRGWEMADPDSLVLFLGAGDRLLSLPDPIIPGSKGPRVIFGRVLLDQGKEFRSRSGTWLKLFNSLHHQALLVPKILHPQPPFNLKFPLYADFDFNQRLYKEGVHFQFDANFSSYAAPAGITRMTHLDELLRIVKKNFGGFWSTLSRLGFFLAEYLPFLKVLRPIR